MLFLCKSEINDAETLAFLFTEILHLYLPLTPFLKSMHQPLYNQRFL